MLSWQILWFLSASAGEYRDGTLKTLRLNPFKFLRTFRDHILVSYDGI
jgi:hypothetical protein